MDKEMKKCIDCDRVLSRNKYTRCKSCARKYLLKNNPNLHNFKGKFGINSNNFKHGKTYHNRCKDCFSHISFAAIRCLKCAKAGKLHPMYGKIGRHGRGANYNNIWMRSSYEIKFAQWLDDHFVPWQYESKTFDLGDMTYTPDFYLPEINLHIEIKGYWRDDAKKKFDLFLQKYPTTKIKVFNKEKLQSIGVL